MVNSRLCIQTWLGLAKDYSLIPLKSNGKRPLIEWKQYQRERADERTIRGWCDQWPDANLGIVTGAVSGVVVADLDDADAVDWADRQLPRSPLRVATGRGQHWYFKHPGSDVPCTSPGVPGVDTRGDGGYVVGPGSIHESGQIYGVIHAPKPGEQLPVYDQAWFLRLELPDYWDEPIARGERNGTAFRRAAWLLNDGRRTRGEAWDQLQSWNDHCCLPPLDEGELQQTLDSAMHRAGDNSVSSVSMSWAEPLPLDGEELPPFPVDALPQPIAKYVLAVAESVQVPVDMPAMLALAVGATTTARRFEVHVQGDHVEPTNLWTVCVMTSGSRKSSCFREMVFPLVDHERATGTRLIGGDDATPEVIPNLIGENGNRIAIMSPEGGVFDFMEGRKDGGAGLDVYLKSHAGDDHCVDRITREGARLERPALTMGLAVQPEVIANIMESKSFRGRGAIARMLIVVPRNLVGHRCVRPIPISEDVKTSYWRAVQAALQRGSETEIVRLHASSEALDVWAEVAERVESRQAEGEDLEHIADWASKSAGAVARIAGVLHVLAGIEGDEIGVDTMRSAVRIGEYLVHHAIYAFGQMGADQDLAGSRRIVRWVQAEGIERFTRRDVMRKFQSRFPKAADLDGPLEVLVSHGHIRPDEVKSKGPGRRSESYLVNPRTLRQKRQK